MYCKLSSFVLFRKYKSFGYVTDDRNYSYIKTANEDSNIGDRVLSESGSIFFSALSKTPQKIEFIARKIQRAYKNTSIEQIQTDLEAFFNEPELSGFVVSGNTKQECNQHDYRFSYRMLEPSSLASNSSPQDLPSKKTTQDFLKDHFNNMPQLSSLHLEVTSKCNERCVHCYIPHDSKIHNIDPTLFYSILRQSKRMNVLHLTLSGGEPMLHPQFCDFLKLCRKYDFSVSILSNLTLLTDDIVNEMKRNPLLGVQVSLYSMDPDTHDRITATKGSFEITVNSILKLIENNIPLQISCPILRLNRDNYSCVKDWAKSKNIHVGDDYNIIARYNHTAQNLESRLSIDEIKDIIATLIIKDAQYIDNVLIEAATKKNRSSDDFVCSVGSSSICVTENGDFYPCAGWQDYKLGNIRNTSLKDIWNDSPKLNYLRNLRVKDFPKCTNCPDAEFCTMCMVRNANEDPLGDPFAINTFFCDIAKLQNELLSQYKPSNN